MNQVVTGGAVWWQDSCSTTAMNETLFQGYVKGLVEHYLVVIKICFEILWTGCLDLMTYYIGLVDYRHMGLADVV